MRSGRRVARELAFQSLFELESRPGHALEGVLSGRVDEMSEQGGGFVGGPTVAFARQLVEGTLAHRKTIDRRIQEVAPAFPLDQMPLTDRVALEIGAYELLHGKTASIGVIINESVELAKIYGGENSGRFVNGVLGTIAEDIADGPAASRSAPVSSIDSKESGRR